jgi:hypothetical protein
MGSHPTYIHCLRVEKA